MTRQLSLILGPMFAGKTKELIKQYRYYKSLGVKCLLLKPAIDNRYGIAVVGTHDGDREPALPVDKDDISLLRIINEYKILFFDEVQFFSASDILACLMMDKEVIAAGLMADVNDKMWNTVSKIIPYATKIETKHADCNICKKKDIALLTKRKDDNNDKLIQIGGDDIYETVCVNCVYEVPLFISHPMQ